MPRIKKVSKPASTETEGAIDQNKKVSKPASTETEGAIDQKAFNIPVSPMELPLNAKRGIKTKINLTGKSMAQEKPSGPEGSPVTLAPGGSSTVTLAPGGSSNVPRMRKPSKPFPTLAPANKMQRGSSLQPSSRIKGKPEEFLFPS